MGAQATLILINGRRVTPYGFASGGQTTFVDVNSIPLDAIERVEILLDSASAVYGSEAMAGVINIILRKDFTGYEANAGYGVSSEGDAARKHVGVTAGFGSPGKDNYNLLFSLEHQENDPLRADQRPNSSTADYSRLACPTGDRAIPIRATSMAPASSGRWRGARPSTTTRVRRSMAAVSMTRPSIRI
jgi:iron complex outermembrane receptor protein